MTKAAEEPFYKHVSRLCTTGMNICIFRIEITAQKFRKAA